MFKYKTEAELTALTPAERDTYAAEKRKHESDLLQTAIKTANEAERTEIQKLIDAAKPAFMVTKEQFDELMENVNQLKEQGSAGTNKVESLLEVVKANKEGLEKSTKKGARHEFVVKADTLRASVVGNPNALDLTSIGQLAHRRLTMYDVFRKVPVAPGQNGVVRYVDWDAATSVRAAAAIAEAGTFPESEAKWATYTLNLMKVGDTIPMSEELVYDAAQFAAELENFLRTNVAIKIDTDLVTGNGTSPNIKGIKAYAPAYTAVAAGITDASIYDLIVKMKETISASYGSKYQPNLALMNISDINKYKLKKDQNNNYIMPPFVDRNGNTIDGVLVLECNAFTANTMVLGDSRFAAIYEEPGFTVETAYNGTDFVEDMMTMKARKRLNLLIRNVDQTGWLECADIDAALTTLAS